MEKILLVLPFLDCIIANNNLSDPDDNAGGEPFVFWDGHKTSGYTVGSSSASRSISKHISSFGLSLEGNQDCCSADSTNPAALQVDGKLSDVICISQEAAPSDQGSVESFPARGPASFLTSYFHSANEFRAPSGSASLYNHVHSIGLNVSAPCTQLESSTSDPESHIIDIDSAAGPQQGGRSWTLALIDLRQTFCSVRPIVAPPTQLDLSTSQPESHVIVMNVAADPQQGGHWQVLSQMDSRKIFGSVRLNVAPLTQLESSTLQHESHVLDINVATDSQQGGRWRVSPPMDLGKIFLSLTYQAVFSFVIFQYQAAGNNSSSQDDSPKPPPLLQIAEVSLVVGFTASLNGILLRQAYPEKAVIIEKVGSVASSICFFLVVNMVLSSVSGWTCWLGAALSLLAFVLAFLKR